MRNVNCLENCTASDSTYKSHLLDEIRPDVRQAVCDHHQFVANSISVSVLRSEHLITNNYQGSLHVNTKRYIVQLFSFRLHFPAIYTNTQKVASEMTLPT